MGPHEPYWQTNSSFSPPPSRWDFHFQSEGEGLPYGSHDHIRLCGSSTSSKSKESKNWVRGNQLYRHQYSASDSAGLFLSSPSDLSQAPQWTPPTIQEISIDNYEAPARRVLRQCSFTPTIEGMSANADSRGSTSSHSDSSESEPKAKSCVSSHRNFSSRLSFMSKPVYPLSFLAQPSVRETTNSAATLFLDYDASTPQREAPRWSSASSSTDFADISEPIESESYGRSHIPSDGFKCGLCERFLSQRSPWSSRRIVRSGDMPVVGVLSCCHVFHAECLEQATPKTHRGDPPCPLCVRLQEENSPDQQVFSRLKNGFSRPRPSFEDGQSRPWGCGQVGECVERALLVPPRNNTMLLLNRSHIKKNLSLKGNSSKEFPGKLRKTGSYSSQLFSGKSVDQGTVGCSKTTAGPSMKR
ncbi:uncharacterized protein LOC116105993 isoform X2 [Pistacia vera]|uniref:uncharacterized protein LOC116105993 isoform X2 n=1 Tax=Pistacia vera TaxID=55513 RepID=UPI001263DF74|nr:uncharacterized protein LOC116105993 isoform X2 [Pistacia vera]